MNPQKGQAAFSVVFLIGGIMIAVGVTLALLYLNFLNSTFGFQLAQKAEAVAAGGAQDALMQLTRGKSIGALAGYSVDVSGSNATVTVVQNSAGQAVITSTGSASGFSRRIQAVALIDTTTKQVNLVSWRLVTF